jgi:phospholipid transport system substrate-binding protein
MKRYASFFSCFFVTLGLALLVQAAPARAASSTEASAYIQNLGDSALQIISNKKSSREQKQAALEKIFAGNVDFPWVGRFVLGRYWREASEAQKARYQEHYKKFLILHYTSRFSDYTGGTFKVTSVRDDGDNEYTVGMQLHADDASSDPVFIEYRVRKEEKSFKIFDVIVEGVSMLTTQRSEFASVITNKGLDYLIDQLASKSMVPSKPKKTASAS